MQANGSAGDASSEVQKTSGGNVDGLVPDLKSASLTNAVTSAGLIASPQASNFSTNNSNNNNNNNCNNNNDQQSLRSSSSPPAYQHQNMPATAEQPNSSNQPMASTTSSTSANSQNHHQGTHGYHSNNPRHGNTYNNQQQMQHYHHQHNKYHSSFRGDNESNANHVLLITVINPHSTITCNVMHQICSPYGKINRIVIFRKNGVQAMVEFDNVESAKQTKLMLHGCDMYTGCCTLRIEYAKPTRLNIHKNDNDSFDYTNPNLSIDGGTDSVEDTAEGVDSGTNLGENSHLQSGQHHSLHQSHGAHSASRGRNSGTGNNQFPHHGSSSTPHHSQVQSTSIVGSQPTGTNAQSGTSGVYGIGSSLDQSAPSAADSFQHEDGEFSRSGAGANGGDAPPPYVSGDDSYLQSPRATGAHGSLQGNLYSSRQDGHHHQHHHQHSRGTNLVGGQSHSSSFSSANASNALMHGPNFGLQGTVMMVYGLQPERVNCERLFNLFCLYGNVSRVKFLRTKEGCAMVQMGDVHAVDRCVSSLNKITLFGSELQISYSKQVFLHDVVQPFILPDGSLSFKDFSGNKNNRFKNPEVASKNRILPPSQVLHFFNAPYGITEDELVHLFKQTAGHEPVTIKIFIPKADNSKSFSGLVTFKDSAEATETLVMCNHLSMPKPGAPNPYILRLCFSPPTYMRQQPPQYASSTN